MYTFNTYIGSSGGTQGYHIHPYPVGMQLPGRGHCPIVSVPPIGQ
jgi:hypothetical protein